MIYSDDQQNRGRGWYSGHVEVAEYDTRRTISSRTVRQVFPFKVCSSNSSKWTQNDDDDVSTDIVFNVTLFVVRCIEFDYKDALN